MCTGKFLDTMSTDDYVSGCKAGKDGYCKKCGFAMDSESMSSVGGKLAAARLDEIEKAEGKNKSKKGKKG